MSEAVQKVRSEMDGNKNNPYVQIIGNFLIGHLEQHPQDGEKITAEDKTIAKSLDAMRKVAEKKKTGNFAMLTPEEGYAAVLDYFGIAADSTTLAAEKPAPPKSDFEVKLEDYF